MDYFVKMFNTPYYLWTIDQAMVFFLMCVGAMFVAFAIVGLIIFVIDKIKAWKNKKRKEKKDER